MIDVDLDEPGEADKLMDAATYKALVETPHGPSGH